MIEPDAFVHGLRESGVALFAGVPDSLLSELCAHVDATCEAHEHVIAANEGNAIALAIGHHLATGGAAAVYLQNSGLGNTINPLTSLADPAVYSVPMLLVIGWRGEPGVSDEPQHVTQGRITRDQLSILGIPTWTLDADSDVVDVTQAATAEMKKRNAPVALLVRKNTFASSGRHPAVEMDSDLRREDALARLLELAGDALVVATTGKTSREVFELRERRGEVQRDFLTVGGMGHTSSIALGVALGCPERRVLCLDGDGSLLMHLGALPVSGGVSPSNLLHVLLNNGCHESVGGQPTVGSTTDFGAMALASGYRGYEVARTETEIAEAWARLEWLPGPAMLEVRIRPGSRRDLGRPTSTPRENKESFMANARGEAGRS